jgi:thioredoxin reductase (NADPH)
MGGMESNRKQKIYDLVIIGSGPAGYSAAIQSARNGLDTFVFQGFEMGGQLMLYSDINDYPGVEGSVSGLDLADRFERQALDAGARMKPDNVARVDFSDYPFRVWAEGDDVPVESRTVIVATGAKHKWLGLADEQRLMGRGVSGCAICDAFFFSGKQVAVVGGGDRAMHETLFLTQFANHVTVINRSRRFRASKKLLDRVRENTKISIFESTIVQYVMGEEAVSGLWLTNVETGEHGILHVDGVFVAIGSTPNSNLFREFLGVDEKGYIVQKEGTMTSILGVFSAGKVSDRHYRTLSTAIGDGTRAAVDAQRWLGKQP